MNNTIKIASWNLCLRLMNKKNYVSQMILDEQIDICCLQEIEIKTEVDKDLLSFRGYFCMFITKIHSKYQIRDMMIEIQTIEGG